MKVVINSLGQFIGINKSGQEVTLILISSDQMIRFWRILWTKRKLLLMGAHSSLYNIQFMSYLHSQELIGKILAITALSLAAPCTLLAKHYSRTLYFAQMLFLFSSVFQTTTDSNFSMNLNFSWLNFMPSFTNHYCDQGDFSCDYGYLISPGLVWLGGAVAFFLIFKLIACRMGNLHFLRFYAFYRGFFHWFMGPLVYFSTARIIKAIQYSNFDVSFTSAIIVLAVFCLIAVLQLISSQVAQQQQDRICEKWIFFFGHINVAAMMVFVALYSYNSHADAAKYMLNIPLVLYSIIFIAKYRFLFKVAERIVVILQDAIIITCYNIFAINYVYIADNNLDFFALVIVAGLELIILFPKFIRFFKPQKDMHSQIDQYQIGRIQRYNYGERFVQTNPHINRTYQGLNGGHFYSSSNPART